MAGVMQTAFGRMSDIIVLMGVSELNKSCFVLRRKPDL